MDREFDALMEEISASGELVTAEALADPATSTLYGWSPEGHLATDGPYAETKEQLAGFFLIDCATRERAEEIAAQFAQPGGAVELRPAMWPGGDDAVSLDDQLRCRGRVAGVRAARPRRPGAPVRRLRPRRGRTAGGAAGGGPAVAGRRRARQPDAAG